MVPEPTRSRQGEARGRGRYGRDGRESPHHHHHADNLLTGGAQAGRVYYPPPPQPLTLSVCCMRRFIVRQFSPNTGRAPPPPSP